jgi:hypothetical protein
VVWTGDSNTIISAEVPEVRDFVFATPLMKKLFK